MPSPADGLLRTQVVEARDALNALAGPWDALAARAGVTIFQTHEWLSAWWAALGEPRPLRVITVWQGADLVGIAPFFVETTGIGGARLARRLRFLGAEVSDYLQVIMLPGLEEPVAQVIADHLCSTTDWDLLILEDVPEGCTSVRSLMTALGARACRCTRRIQHWSYGVPLPPTYEEFLARLDPHRRKEFGRLARRLRDGGVELVTGPEIGPVGAALEEFIRLQRTQWNGAAEEWALADPRIQRFHHDVAQAFQGRGWLDLVFLRHPRGTVAGSYDFRYGGKVFGYLSGLDRESAWKRFSPGIVLNLACIKRAIADGFTEYDLMRGDERYKSTLRAVERVNYCYKVTSPRPAAAVRGLAYEALSFPWWGGRWIRGKAGGLRRRLAGVTSGLVRRPTR